ncbi:asparagine-linked glycosylation protein [Mortierella sp. AM989]|nr:asparagine-linked glycosylation protein [Mortierella sp. AM989]
MQRPMMPLSRVIARKAAQRALPLCYSVQCRPTLLLQRNFHATRKTLYSAPNESRESYASRVKKAWTDTPLDWTPIPIGVGLTFIAFLQFRKIRKRDEENSQDVTKAVVVGPWQVHLISELPLKTISSLWGAFNSINLPTWLRVPGFKLYSWIFGCNLEEMKDPDLRHYKNLSEFFYRELKDGVRPVDINAALVSPSDGRVFHFGLVDGSRVEQIKGMSYSLEQFLGSQKAGEMAEIIKSTHSANIVDEEEFAKVNGIDYTLNSLLGNDQQSSIEHKKQDVKGNILPDEEADKKSKSSDNQGQLKLRPGNALFFCVIYLAPGDYHRFHSPTNWVAETRRHFSGELYSVSPWMVKQLQDLFVLNERVVLLGKWRYGFFSMVPVGATNVGSIVLNFDKELRTNRREDRHKRGYGELVYSGASRLLNGQPLRVGEEMGGFKLGSTVVLVFEAPKNFKFVIEPGQRVKMGQPLGQLESTRKRVFEEQARIREEQEKSKTATTTTSSKKDTEAKENNKVTPYLIAGFFHPYWYDRYQLDLIFIVNFLMTTTLIILDEFYDFSNAGGGGERVLWTAIRDIQVKYPHVISIVYTGDTDVTKEDILERVSTRFNIELNPALIGFEFLTKRHWVEDSKWPRFTLIGQSIGSMVLGWEALRLVVPDIWIDTMGYAFTYPAARAFGACQVVAYVHYPTISSDMIGRVASRESAHNNASEVASSTFYTTLKLAYYRCFAVLYTYAGAFAHVVMVNSSWTKGHIDSLWKIKSTVVYPPCDTEAFKDFPLKGRERIVVSVAQFRPEKGHGLQLDALAQLLKDHPEYRQKRGTETNPQAVQLVMVGSARNESDQARINQLKDKAVQLGISDNVTFVVNAPFSELKAWLARSKIGIHAMLDEHFGIGVVEYMAAGLVPVAHNSAGPKMDIVQPYNNEPTGYLATTAQEFADAIEKVLSTDESALLDLQIRARDSVQERFSEWVFGNQLQNCLHEILSREKITIYGRKMVPLPEVKL